MHWFLIFFVFLGGCSLLDRQQAPEILEVRANRELSVGRGQEVNITIMTDDGDNDELDYLWIASGGTFANNRDTVVALFQDSATVTWKAPVDVGIYDLFLEVGDGKSEEPATSDLQISVMQTPPIVAIGPDQALVYNDTLVVVLDATESKDLDGDELNYYWEQIRGPRAPRASC